MSSAAKVQQLTSLIKHGSLAERQGAFEVLGTLRTAESREALGQYLDELQAGTAGAGAADRSRSKPRRPTARRR